MAQNLPPVPTKVPMLNAQGFLNDVWEKWFRDMFNRIGGKSALTNKELETLQATDLSGISTQVTTLQNQVAALQLSVSDLNQGPKL